MYVLTGPRKCAKILTQAASSGAEQLISGSYVKPYEVTRLIRTIAREQATILTRALVKGGLRHLQCSGLCADMVYNNTAVVATHIPYNTSMGQQHSHGRDLVDAFLHSQLNRLSL
eukprot:COSAG01_NODE_1138_length_11546_cov_11.035206_3_plen_115_part_00